MFYYTVYSPVCSTIFDSDSLQRGDCDGLKATETGAQTKMNSYPSTDDSNLKVAV